MQQKTKTLTVVIIALLMPILPFVVVGELPGERWLSASDDNALVFSATATGLLVADVLLPIPSSLILTLTGARLGFGLGWLLCWAGLTLGNALGYLLGRCWPAKYSPNVESAPAVLALMLSRPIPILAEAMIISAGAARTNAVRALLACAIGNAFYVAVMAAIGATLLAQQQMLLALVLVMLVPSVGWLIWRRRL